MFTVDWFSAKIPQWEKTLKDYYNKDNVRVLEIGSYEGRSSLYICNKILTGKNVKLTCVDRWDTDIELKEIMGDVIYNRLKDDTVYNLFKSNLKEHIANGKVEIIRGKSVEKLPELLIEIDKNKREYYDFIYVDGSHNAKNCLVDSILAFELLKVGGILIFDDYLWSMFLEEEKNPKIAIDSFLKVYKQRYEIIYSGYQVHIKKLNEPHWI